ncbi:MAG: 4-alpha-glucanotransferase [Deltaproteobacteria bacterium]|nr:4-alpha-glucanotransferase [Deltaproteobacteria bacterium]
MKPAELRTLRALAALHGVETEFRDAFGHRRAATPQALLATLRALGVNVDRARDLAPALDLRQREIWSRACEPVTVAWEGEAVRVTLRLPEERAGEIVSCRLQTEDGESRCWRALPGEMPASRAGRVDGRRYVQKEIVLPRRLPRGYHRLSLETGGREFETLLISAPARAFEPPARNQRSWGVFLPLHALGSARGWGSGDFTDLASLLRWTAARGGRLVGTLPLLAAFLDEHFEPSPYSPASRLFWNEFFIDVARVPELRRCAGARRLIGSGAFRREIDRLRGGDQVDYRRGMAQKRRVLELLCRSFFASAPVARRLEFERFVAARPALPDYARFRAVNERRRTAWERWPRRLREGAIVAGDYDRAAYRYHLYAQWIADAQLARASRAGRGAGLYLDLPLGASRHGYDVWRERGSFALGASTGAPPDPVFTGGQDWGFPPPHPDGIREEGYRYFIATLRHHLARASVLRIDHVMGLQRLFWIPSGLDASQGVYVRYRAQELYAILCLESWRAGAVIAGENLGTVPPEVDEMMARCGVQRLHVLQYDVEGHARGPGPVPRGAVASLNTHDMPTFAAFLSGDDIEDRASLGLHAPAGARKERARRVRIVGALRRFLVRRRRLAKGKGGAASLLDACLAFLAASPARIVLVNLEDLWGERRPQNVPGTGRERPNWRRKAALTFESFSRSPRVVETLRRIAALRRKGAGGR